MKIGAITIGQAPRTDVTADILRIFDDSLELVQAGGLDGLTKEEIDERIEDIIDFSEIREFIDNPVRTYSSGMYMRLAFSVAINVDADILLIDEILSVGDQHFQEKCYSKIEELKKQGVTIVFVTHSLGAVERFCTRAVWLHDGVVKLDGDAREVVKTYVEETK